MISDSWEERAMTVWHWEIAMKDPESMPSEMLYPVLDLSSFSDMSEASDQAKSFVSVPLNVMPASKVPAM